MERAWKANVEISPNCPRCGSSNTKFCYYNNYSLTQPRYFCKGCRRYWTKGGSLRNVPVGGGCRKNRRVNRALRQPNIGGVPHSNLPYGESATNVSNIYHSYGPRNSSSSRSSAVSDGPNIDLALVYANFLNSNPDSRSIEKEPEMQSTDFDSSVEVGPSMITNLPEELGFSAGFLNRPEQSGEISHFSEGNEMYFGGFNYIQNNQQADRIDQRCSKNDIVNNFELPPLPGEDQAASVHDMIWSDSDMMVNNDNLQTTELPVFGAEVIHDQEDLIMGNWSPFDLPRDAPFSRP